MRRALLHFALLSSFALTSSTASAIPLLNGFGGPTGYGTGNLPGNDDGSSGPNDLTVAFPGGLRYFGATYSTFYVNNNGNITFSGPLGTFTPAAFPIASQPMIAPWWGDVDTRAGGFPMINGLWWHTEPGRVVVTWDHVGYYSMQSDLLNSFQLILSTDPSCPGPGNFDVEFRYAQCQWTTGSASGGMNGLGGTPAQAGFDAGNTRDYYAIPGSLTGAILDVCTTSNGGAPGDWIFTICDGVITGGCPGAGAPCTVAGQSGVCARGVNHCAGMGGTVCAQTVMPSPEICDGLDNDCNGAVDDAIAPRRCYDGALGTESVGVCHGGASSCTMAAFGPCIGEVVPSTEICDGLDNDCNGMIDDMPPRTCYSGPAGTEGVGACHAGAQRCNVGSWGTCAGDVTPTAEICDGYDNDCDGVVDNGLINCRVEPIPDAGTDAYDATDIVSTDVTDVATDIVSTDVRDVASDSTLPPDARTTTCGGDPRCDPSLRIQGRAGPIGCACRSTPGSRSDGTPVLAAIAGLACALVIRRRRRSVGALPRPRT